MTGTQGRHRPRQRRRAITCALLADSPTLNADGAADTLSGGSATDYVITVIFNSATAGTITLKGITTASANFNRLSVTAAAANSDTCAPAVEP